MPAASRWVWFGTESSQWHSLLGHGAPGTRVRTVWVERLRRLHPSLRILCICFCFLYTRVVSPLDVIFVLVVQPSCSVFSRRLTSRNRRFKRRSLNPADRTITSGRSALLQGSKKAMILWNRRSFSHHPNPDHPKRPTIRMYFKTQIFFEIAAVHHKTRKCAFDLCSNSAIIGLAVQKKWFFFASLLSWAPIWLSLHAINH